ncbi:MAG: MarR family transcriptional regulator [Alphaproteobacteria bacterium]|nr:MarR family transcriptional regulator [Alphaproteobacteria bacterium]
MSTLTGVTTIKTLTMCPVFGLYAASRKLIKLYTLELEKVGLTYPQYLVIASLHINDGVSVDAIGRELFLDSGTLTPLLKRLEIAGFITREHSKDDERKKVIRLTLKGRDFDATSIQHNVKQRVNISSEEIQHLRTLLEKILITTL